MRRVSRRAYEEVQADRINEKKTRQDMEGEGGLIRGVGEPEA